MQRPHRTLPDGNAIHAEMAILCIDGIGRRSSVQESIMLAEIRRSGWWIDEEWIVGLLAASECREASEIVG